MKKVIKIMILFLLGVAALFAAYLYIKQQTVDSRQRSMANTAAISSMFLSSVSLLWAAPGLWKNSRSHMDWLLKMKVILKPGKN